MSFPSTSRIKRSVVSGWALRLALNLPQKMASTQRLDRCSDQGLTLIEGLLAIIVIAVTVISITPPIFWATASRVQTERAGQALRIAQGEIDRVRNLVERDNFELSDLPPEAGTETEVRGGSVGAPSAAKDSTKVVSAKPSCPKDTGIPQSKNQYIQVDINGDCQVDFLVQTFRSRGFNDDSPPVATPIGAKPAAFVTGVRVYSFVAKAKLDANQGKVEQASFKGTTGLGNQQEQPLAVLYSTVVPSNLSTNIDIYRNLCPAPPADLQGNRHC